MTTTKNDALEVKWPWTLIYLEFADEFIAQIKEALPPDHELQQHKLFPAIKWERRPIFIVDDDTTGQRLFMNFGKCEIILAVLPQGCARTNDVLGFPHHPLLHATTCALLGHRGRMNME